MSNMQRIDGTPLTNSKDRLQRDEVAAKRERMTEAQRQDYVIAAMQKNRLRREYGNTVASGGDLETLQEIAQKRKQIEMQEVASSIAHMHFPKTVFDRWANEQPPRAAAEPDVLIWTCETCGITVMPNVVSYGYIRANCPCQRRQIDQRTNKEADRRSEELRREEMVNMFKKIGRYSWLAPQHHLDLKTFDNFDLDRVEREDRAEVEFAIKFARRFAQRPAGNVIAYGPSGSGKTHIFSALLNAWCDAGNTGLYANAIDLFAVIDSLRTTDTNPMDIENKMKWCDLLIIDEIDRVKLTDARFGLYYRILNYRSQKEMETSGSAPTILIGNTTISGDNAAFDLETHIGTASVSRIQIGLKPIFIPGIDQRTK